MILKHSVLLLSICSCLAVPAKADLLAWYLDGTNAGSVATGGAGSLTNLATAGGVSATDMNVTDFAVDTGSALTNTPAGLATPDNNYWLFASGRASGVGDLAFSMQADPGQQISLTSLSFDTLMISDDPGGGEDLIARMTLSYSTDGSNWTNMTNFFDTLYPAPSGIVEGSGYTFNFGNVVSETFYFRLHVDAVTGDGLTAPSLYGLGIGNFQVNGNVVPIPEPSAVLMGLAAFALVPLRRRR